MYGTYISHFHQASSFLFSKLLSKSKGRKGEKKVLCSLSLKIYVVGFFNLWTQKPVPAIRAVRGRSQKTLAELWENSLKYPVIAITSKHHSNALLERSTVQDRRKVWCQPRDVSRSKQDARILLLQNILCILHRQEYKTTNVYVAFHTSLSNMNWAKLLVFILVVSLTAPGWRARSRNKPKDQTQELPCTQLCRLLNKHRAAIAGPVGNSWSAKLLPTSVRTR